jgi:hypothetical protein
MHFILTRVLTRLRDQRKLYSEGARKEHVSETHTTHTFIATFGMHFILTRVLTRDKRKLYSEGARKEHVSEIRWLIRWLSSPDGDIPARFC